MRLAVVGNPENRRVTMFSAAAESAGLAAPEVFAWRDVLLSGRVPGPGTLVRIDSPGENAEVDGLLRALGGDRSGVAPEHGEIAGGAAVFAGLGRALERVAAGGGTLLNDPGDILAMTSKPRCHALLTAAAIPVPAALGPVALGPATLGPVALGPVSHRPTALGPATLRPTAFGPTAPEPAAPEPAAPEPAAPEPAAPGADTVGADTVGLVDGYESLRAAMTAAGCGRVFVKAAYGSSASGVVALAVGGPGRIMAVTSVELSEGKIFNNLRVRRYDDEPSIAAIVDRLAPDGLHVERWYPKAALGGRVLDLRVVVIAGRARHVVVRTSRSPMTNLHLGNARGDVSAVRAAVGERGWAAAMETCVRAAGCFPRSLHAGVDLMFRTGWRGHAVAEVNAFGDLLPGIRSDDGLDTYEAEIAAVIAGWQPPPAP
ncbi:STM4014 family protein [Actinoplanes sp. L3-i22]|uniref:STM4014 family protein n=1 Tax=Actinoplanes sp. L3-i22 TaxID=2836373 RepID=UPI001C78A0F3|nr:STM4014 family protein [Actinoplanes sp. L3-i22]BCY11148.1 hypothetical protein L3i22_062360 [Actinoplanes sp. L3-i22]